MTYLSLLTMVQSGKCFLVLARLMSYIARGLTMELQIVVLDARTEELIVYSQAKSPLSAILLMRWV